MNSLEATIRRKTRQVEAILKELGDEAIEERLKSAVEVPANPPYRLSQAVAALREQGRVALVLELARPSPSAPPSRLAEVAERYVSCGAHALALCTDSEDTPEGLKDLFAVCRAVSAPVLRSDWIVHPLQVAEAKEAGAAGVLGVITQVNGRATPLMSSFAARMGLDAPVEVVNAMEADAMGRTGVGFFGVNLSVGISLALPGVANQIAYGVLGGLPFGSLSLVGVRTLEDARRACESRADALLVKRQLLEGVGLKGVRALLQELTYITSGDD